MTWASCWHYKLLLEPTWIVNSPNDQYDQFVYLHHFKAASERPTRNQNSPWYSWQRWSTHWLDLTRLSIKLIHQTLIKNELWPLLITRSMIPTVEWYRLLILRHTQCLILSLSDTYYTPKLRGNPSSHDSERQPCRSVHKKLNLKILGFLIV